MQDKLLQMNSDERQKQVENKEVELQKMEKEILIKDNLLKNFENNCKNL